MCQYGTGSYRGKREINYAERITPSEALAKMEEVSLFRDGNTNEK
jgi:hypothetical protein